MKIVLLEDVKTLGKKGDIVEVSPGYARNKILPQKLGIEATPKALNDLKLQEKHVEKVAKENNANVTVKRFVRFETGEGIEKKQEDFAAEVAAQMGN